MTNTGLVLKPHWNDTDIAQLHQLEAACLRTDGIRVKWDLSPDRDPADFREFAWYEQGRIVGGVQIDGSGAECEVTGAVLPSHRGRGIFRRLFEAARSEAQRRGARQLLLISYPGCPTGAAVARRLGTNYRFSEYRLEAPAADVPPLPPSGLRLEEVTGGNISELSQTMRLSLGGGRWQEPDALQRALQQPGQRFLLAKLGPETLGQIGIVTLPDDVYLRAIGILPARRRQGWGRQMLAATLHRLMAEGHAHFTLDVQTNNAQALSLYGDCGFRETMAYDYSDVPMT